MSVTLNNYGKMANMNTAEFYGKSTDEKPTEQNGGNIINGSIYVEIDTGRAYFYDAEMKMWTPVTPPSADGTYTKEQINALLDKKMSYYIVTVNGNKIVHEGEVLTYAKIQQLYEDESVFIYMEHAGLTLIPSVDVDNSIIAFSSDWMRKEGTGYEPFIYVVQITSDNTVTSQQFQIEDAANKVTVINSRNATSEEKYPSVKAVVDYVDKDGINAEITDIKEDLSELNNRWIVGKNKFNLNDVLQNKNIDTNGDIINSNDFNLYGKIPVEQGKTYTLSNDGVLYPYALHGVYNVNEEFIERGTGSTFTVQQDGYVYIRLENTLDISKMQLEEGNKATSFEMYTHVIERYEYGLDLAHENKSYINNMKVDLSVSTTGIRIANLKTVREIEFEQGTSVLITGKNILKLRSNIPQSTNISGVDITVNNDGSVSFSGTATSQITFSLTPPGSYDGSIVLGLGKYIVSGGDNDIYLQVLCNDGNTRSVLGEEKGSGFVITQDDFSKRYEFRYVVLNGRSVDVTLYPQVELGEEKTLFSKFSFSTVYENSGDIANIEFSEPITITNSSGSLMTVSYDSIYNQMFNMAIPQQYGAVGDGIHDDTIALQKCFDKNEVVFIPCGTYLVNDTGLNLNHKMVIYGNKAIIKKKPSNSVHYTIVNITGDDVKIYDLQVVGDNKDGKDITGEWGHGFSVNAINVALVNCVAKYCYGDGFYIGGYKRAKNLILENCWSDYARRNGYSIIDSMDFIIANCKASHTDSADPKCGIDLEPNNSAQAIKGTITNFMSEENFNSAFNLNLVNVDENSIVDVTVDGLQSINDGNNQHGSGMVAIYQTKNCYGVLNLKNIVVRNSIHTPLFYEAKAEKLIQTNIENFTAISCRSINSTMFIVTPNASLTTETITSLNVRGFKVINKINPNHWDMYIRDTERKMRFVFEQSNENFRYYTSGSTILIPYTTEYTPE